eukprot:RCo035482
MSSSMRYFVSKGRAYSSTGKLLLFWILKGTAVLVNGSTGPRVSSSGLTTSEISSPTPRQSTNAGRGLVAILNTTCWLAATPSDGTKLMVTVETSPGCRTPWSGEQWNRGRLPPLLLGFFSSRRMATHSQGRGLVLLRWTGISLVSPTRTVPKSSLSAERLSVGIITIARTSTSTRGPPLMSTGTIRAKGPSPMLFSRVSRVSSRVREAHCGYPGSLAMRSVEIETPEPAIARRSNTTETGAKLGLVTLKVFLRVSPFTMDPKSYTYRVRTGLTSPEPATLRVSTGNPGSSGGGGGGTAFRSGTLSTVSAPGPAELSAAS